LPTGALLKYSFFASVIFGSSSAPIDEGSGPA